MRRGEVWWARIGGPAGNRPVVLVGREESYRVRELVVVVPVSTRIRSLPTEVRLGPEDGMSSECVVNADVVQSISKSRLDRRITALTSSKARALDDALRFALGLD